MKTQVALCLGLLFALALWACQESPDNPGGPGTGEPGDMAFVESDLERESSPSISESDFQALNSGNNAFSMELYHNVADSVENLVYSPYSISTALAMTYAGSVGNTKDEMASTLQFALDDATLHSGFNALDLALESRNREGEETSLTLNIHNNLFGSLNESRRPKESFLDILSLNYGTGLYLLDYQGDPEGSRVKINEAVNDWTESLIPELIPPGIINPDTVLVLTNTIYLYAPWASAFDEDLTEEASFHTHSGDVVSVETMNQELEAGYSNSDGVEVVVLPFEGNELAMVLLIPELGTFDEFEDEMTSSLVENLVSGAHSSQIIIHLPKFSIRTPVLLKDTLESMGMVDAFDRRAADFSEMFDIQVWISEVVHEAFIDVNEQGTEAGAATAVIIQTESAPPPVEAEVFVNRPFVYMIRDMPTGATLFAGRVFDPTL